MIKVPTFAEFKRSAGVLLGVDPGDVGKATEIVRATPPGKRAEYAGKIEAAVKRSKQLQADIDAKAAAESQTAATA